MRTSMLHVNHFSNIIPKKGRPKNVKDCDPNSKTTQVDEALLFLLKVEKRDENNPEDVSKGAAEEVNKLDRQFKVDKVILQSLAHLFREPRKPDIAIEVLKLTKERLVQGGLKVIRTPFSWFKTLELRARGHPLSRVLRTISSS